MNFKIGDRVTHEGYGNGTVIGHYGCGEKAPAAVEFDMPQMRFHRASAYGGKPGKTNRCWYVDESELTPINNPSWILIVRPDKSDPDTTTAILKVDGKEVRRESVKRHYKDIYDMQVAIKAVMAKMGCVDAKPPVTAEPPKPEPPVNKYVLTITDTGKSIQSNGLATGEIRARDVLLAVEAHKLEILKRALETSEIVHD